MAPRFFRIRAKSIIPGEWGDYGRILQHGMTAHLGRSGGRLSLERTGPYIPPITLPGIGDMVLTNSARQALESSGLTGFDFVPIRKALVVELNWENWDLSASQPEFFPDSGEPEDYILGLEHSDSAAAALGDLWEISVPPTAAMHRSGAVVASSWNGVDLFRSADFGGMLFSDRAPDCFSRTWPGLVWFEEFASV